MRKQISHVSVHQTSKVFAILVFLITAIIFIPIGIVALFQGEKQAAFISFGVPFAYLIINYIAWIILNFLYNVIAKHFGGIELDLIDKE